jgi:ABC-2 type transport system ATP-binding protein
MIEVERLTKTYGPNRAIDEVSFRVERGQILGFLGPNGAGKTTTMRILTGFLPPTSGRARVAGFDVVASSLAARRRIGYLPENVPLYPEMTVSGYLRFVAAIKQLAPARRRERMALVLGQCGLEEVAETIIRKLSKGYRQRLGLAQALLHDPEVLVLDEPTVGLDPHQIIGVRQLVKGLAGSRTIILSTHILPEVEQICDRVVILSQGRVIAEDTPANLATRLKGANTLRLVVRRAADTDVAAVRATPGVHAVRFAGERQGGVAFEVEAEPGVDLAEPLARLAIERKLGLCEVAPVGKSLEAVFIELTTREDGGGPRGDRDPAPPAVAEPSRNAVGAA